MDSGVGRLVRHVENGLLEIFLAVCGSSAPAHDEVVELPGRRFNYAKRPQNVRELRKALDGRPAKSILEAPPLPLAMAESRVVLLGFLSHYGLVPSPKEVRSPQRARVECTHRARTVAK